VNKGPFPLDDSKRSHGHLVNKDRLLGTIYKAHIDTLWTKGPLLGTIPTKCTCDLCHVLPIDGSCVRNVYMGPLPRVSNRRVMCPQSKCEIIAQSSRWFILRFEKVTWTPCEQRPITWDDLQSSHRHLVNKGPFTWDHSQRSHRHVWTRDPFLGTIQKGHRDLFESSKGKGPLFTRCLCDLWESSQVKSHLFTRCLCDLWESSQVNGHLFTRCLCDLFGTIRKGRIDTLWTRTLYLGRFSKVTYRHLVNKGPFTWYDSQGSHRHLVNKWLFTSKRSFVYKVSMWPLWIVLSKGSFVQKVYICDLCKSSQVKGPLFTKYQWYRFAKFT
jgi:hypothetical protein